MNIIEGLTNKKDTEAHKLYKNADILLCLLYDEKPTVVRQCIAALHTAVQYKPGLRDKIAAKLDNIDMTKYKDSMCPLIEKDIEKLRRIL